MAYELLRRKLSNRLPANQVSVSPTNGQFTIPADLAARAGLNGHGQVLWDPTARQLAIRPAAPNAPESFLIRNAQGSPAKVFGHTTAVRAIGVKRLRRLTCDVLDGQIVCPVGDPD